MLRLHEQAFKEFKAVHDNYSLDPEKWKGEFNRKGGEILRIISRFENQLCGKSENCGFGKFSSSLSEKFWQTIKEEFPKIDEIGLRLD